MAIVYVGNGKWAEVKLPPFCDFEEMCRQTDELDAQEWQATHNNNIDNERTDEQ